MTTGRLEIDVPNPSGFTRVAERWRLSTGGGSAGTVSGPELRAEPDGGVALGVNPETCANNAL